MGLSRLIGSYLRQIITDVIRAERYDAFFPGDDTSTRELKRLAEVSRWAKTFHAILPGATPFAGLLRVSSGCGSLCIEFPSYNPIAGEWRTSTIVFNAKSADEFIKSFQEGREQMVKRGAHA